MINDSVQSVVTGMVRKLSFLLGAVCTLVALVGLSAGGQLEAAPNVVTDAGFHPADPQRNWMDVGGVWDGTQEVGGDTFSFEVNNLGDSPAYHWTLKAVLPPEFSYVNGSATMASPEGSVHAVQVGNELQFSFSPNMHVPQGGSVRVEFDLVVSGSLSSGTYKLDYHYSYQEEDSPLAEVITPSPREQNVLVARGDRILQVTPKQAVRAMGEMVDYTVTVTNTGVGGLFAVEVDESSLLNSHSLQMVPGTFVQAQPSLPVASVNAGKAVLPYLGPGESFVMTVQAIVVDCDHIVNVVHVRDRVVPAQSSDSASVQLNLQQPLVEHEAETIVLDYDVPVQARIELSNTGAGNAYHYVLKTTLHTLPVTISNVKSGWTYNAASGEFSLDSGVFARDHQEELTFDIVATDVCGGTGAGTVFYNAVYENACGDQYLVPKTLGGVVAAPDAPSIALSQAVSSSEGSSAGPRIAVGKAGTYQLVLQISELQSIATNPIVVLGQLPQEIENVVLTPTDGTVAISGRDVEWTLTHAQLQAAMGGDSGSVRLDIDFTVINDPCEAGQMIYNEVQIQAQSTQNCPLDTTSSASFFVSNNPELEADQFFNVEEAAGGFFETGNPAQGEVRGRGEGQFIPFTAQYSFSENYPGVWSGSQFVDNYGGVEGQSLVPNSLSYRLNGAGLQEVPEAYYSEVGGQLVVDLSFIGGSVSGTELEITYQTTIPDAALGGSSTRSVLQVAELILAEGDGGEGICAEDVQFRFTQGAMYTVGRAVASMSLSLPQQLELCEEYTLRINVGNSNSKNAWNPQIKLNNALSEYTVIDSVAPVFGGVFNSGNIDYQLNGGVDPVFNYTGELTGSGWIELQVVRKSNDTSLQQLTASLGYDSFQSEAQNGAQYSAGASYTPVVVHRADLALRVTPNDLAVIGSQIEYVIYLSNTNSGRAFNTVIEAALPEGFTLNQADTNSRNHWPVDVVSSSEGREFNWALGTLTPGQTVELHVVADVDGSRCSVDSTAHVIHAHWGCGDRSLVGVSQPSPNFTFPEGRMQVVHDSRLSFAAFCGTGQIQVTLNNTGRTEVRNVVLEEVIPLSSSLNYVDGSAQYSIDNGATWHSASDPEVDGNIYRWGKNEIEPLELLVPHGRPGVRTVMVRFNVAGGDALAQQNPEIEARASGELACGSPVLSPGSLLSIRVERPVINVVKTGRNLSTGSAEGAVVYGGQGDVVEWTVTISNVGQAAAPNLRLRDPLSQSNPTAITISGPGYDNEPYDPGSSGRWIAIGTASANPLFGPELAAGDTITYVFRETLGDTCVSGMRKAEVTWGCSNPPEGEPSSVSSPGTSSATTTIEMLPIIGAAEITRDVVHLPGGRAQIDVTLKNQGGNAKDIQIQSLLPAGIVIDTSVDPTLEEGNASFTGLSWDVTALDAPVFALQGSGGGILRQSEQVRIRFYVRTTLEDSTYADTFVNAALAQQESVANGLDPAPFPAGSHRIEVIYHSSCGAQLDGEANLSLKLNVPNISVTAVSPGNRILNNSGQRDYTFTVTNVGEAGSIADQITLDFPQLGERWAVDSIEMLNAGEGGSGGSASLTGGVYTFVPAQVGALAQGESVTVLLRMGYDAEGEGSLRLLLRARGRVVGQDGSTVFGNYSYDQRAQRAIGVHLVKERVETSEEVSNDGDVLIGEEVTWRLRAEFHGGEDVLSNVVISDSLNRGQAAGTVNHNFGYVSHREGAQHNLGPVPLSSAPASVLSEPVSSGRLDFTLDSLSAAQMLSGAVFEQEVVTRVMNVASNSDGSVRTNRLGVQFEYLGEVFRADNNAFTNFSGSAIRFAQLYAEDTVRVYRPQLQVTKQARNLTRSPDVHVSSFADTVHGEAGDVVEYRVIVTNTAAVGSPPRPLYSLRVKDEVSGRLYLLDDDSAGAVSGGNGMVPAVLTDGVVGGAGASIEFNWENTALNVAGADLDRLDPGQSVTLLYRVRLEQAVVPSETLSSTVTVSGQSLPYPAGNQTEPQGTPGEADGALVLESTDAAGAIVVDDVSHGKSILAYSAHEGSAYVAIGEQIHYRVQVELPQGTVPDFKVVDELPAGLALVELKDVVIGMGISEREQPAVTPVPAQLPAQGNPLQIEWDFGLRTATIGSSAAERTVTLEYIVQVVNAAEHRSGKELTNNASYSFSGAPEVIQSISVTVTEPVITLEKEVDVTEPVSAGDILTYTVRVQNGSGTNVSTAYDLNFLDTLPPGVTYVENSVVVLEATGVSGVLAEPDVDPSAGTLLWGREQGERLKLDMEAGASLAFSYQVSIDNDSKPEQVYTNEMRVDWTSLDGDPGPQLGDNVLDSPGQMYGQRNGEGGAANDYFVEAMVTVHAANSTSIVKTASAAQLPIRSDGSVAADPTAYRIGDMVTYTLTVDVQEGTLEAFTVADVLEEGLVFVDTVSISPLDGEEGFNYTLPVAGSTAPAAGASGTLRWEFGTVVNEGGVEPDLLTIVYRARVIDDSGVNPAPSDHSSTVLGRTNTANVTYENALGERYTTEASQVEIIVSQPWIQVEKQLLMPSAYNILRPGKQGRFQITLSNSAGSAAMPNVAPAFNLVLEDRMPVGMRAAGPNLVSVHLNGEDVTAAFSGPSAPSWNGSTGEWVFALEDGQFIEPGKTLVILYDFYIDEDAEKGSTLTNTALVREYYSMPSADEQAAHRRKYGQVEGTAQVIVGLEIKGNVYNDIEPNGHKDAFEDWSSGTAVHVNLLDEDGQVLRSTEVLPGRGEYTLTDIPRGRYRIIVTDSAINTAAQPPPSWLFRSPLSGELQVELTVADQFDQDFGLYRGLVVTGRVFRDDGIGGGTANDGRINGGEQGIGQVMVRLMNGGIEIGRSETDGNGFFSTYIPDAISSGESLAVVVVRPEVHIATGGYAGNAMGVYQRDNDQVAFTFSGSSVSGLEFGYVRENVFNGEGMQTIEPGGFALYRHTFVAGSAGTVTFSVDSTALPAIPWGQVLLLDNDCDGVINGGELAVEGIALSVEAGQEICLLIRDTAPAGAQNGAQYQTMVSAHFVYDHAVPALNQVLTRQNITRVGTTGAAGLTLLKEVDKSHAAPGEEITYTITYTNSGSDRIFELYIDDRTPAFTVFVSAHAETPPAHLDAGVTITQPEVGATGSIRWEFTGELAPGSSGKVSFTVKIQ